MKTINFINVGGPYKKILDSMIEPIVEHLPEAIVTKDAIPGAINVTFFVEGYLHSVAGTMVFISHGIADKKYRNGPTVSRFDYVCVSGSAWEQKMLSEGIPQEKILITGYTKMDPIFQGRVKKTLSERKRILWAPTHNSVPGLSSYPFLEKFFPKIEKDFEVTVSPHPANTKDNLPTLQKLVDADIVIADSGSTLYEAWAIGKQVVFPSWLVKKDRIPDNTFEKEIFTSKLGLHASSEEHLEKIIRSAPAKLSEEVVSFIDKIFPRNLRGSSGLVTAEQLRKVALN